MAPLLAWLLDLFVEAPYILAVLVAAGAFLVRLHGRIRRHLRHNGWARRPRRAIAYATSVVGVAMILLAFGFIVPVGAMLLTSP
jgi:hypothetical protein